MNPDLHLKFRHLNCFLEVARQGSFQRAADTLAITQPAVSKTIRELEDMLGYPLFERGKRGVILTDAGLTFLNAAGPSVQALKHGVRSVMSGDFRTSELRLGVLSSVEVGLVPQLLKRFHDAHPDVVVMAEGGPAKYLLNLLRSGDLDLVVGRLSDSPHVSGLQFESLYGDSLRLVVRAGHPLVGSPMEAVVSGVSEFALVLPTRETSIRQQADSLLLQNGVRLPSTCVETLSTALARSYVQMSDAVWIAPEDAVLADLEKGELEALPLREDYRGGSVGVCCNPSVALSVAGEWCLELLRQMGDARSS